MYSNKVEKKAFMEVVIFKLGLAKTGYLPTGWCTQRQRWKSQEAESRVTMRENHQYKQKRCE